MVHSLCRAGTVSASLLNGNQQESPASGPADDKGMPKAYNSEKAAEKSANTKQAKPRQKNELRLSKKCLSQNPHSTSDFPEQT